MEEMIDVLDESDNIVRQAARSEVRRKALLYKSSYVIVLNGKGEYFVQKRAESKDLWPGMHAIGVGETVKAGEGYEEAAVRSVLEEIGAEAKQLRQLFDIKFRSKEDNENAKVYSCVVDEELEFADGEVSEGFFATEEELRKAIAEKEFEPLSIAIIEKYWGTKNG